MKDFKLELTNPPQGVYFPGMTITGTVVCVTDEPKDYRQILVKLHGRAHVHWSESSGSGNNRRTRRYTSNEEYVSSVAVLWDKTVNGGGGKLPPGSYRFNFCLPLTGANLPASYTGTVGAITYTVEARVVKGVLKRDKTALAAINMANVIPINNPELTRPLSLERQKTVCCLCCASGPIIVTAKLPRTGFCVGYDTIPVEVSVENNSNRNISNVSVSLQKIVLYTAQGHHRYNQETIQLMNTQAVVPGETAFIRPNPIPIPATVIPSLLNCGIISMSYVVRVSPQLSGAINPTIDLPVVIGNKPLQGDDAPEGLSFERPGANFAAPPPYNSADYPPPPCVNTWGGAPTNPLPIGFVDPIKKM